MSTIGGVGGALEDRRSEVSRVEDAGGGVFRCRFFFGVLKAGEGTLLINFPVRFVEKPSISTGWDMYPNQFLVAGRYPIVSAGVYVWNSGKRVDNGTPFYDGCSLAFALIGPSDLAATIHVTFEGKAVRPT